MHIFYAASTSSLNSISILEDDLPSPTGTSTQDEIATLATLKDNSNSPKLSLLTTVNTLRHQQSEALLSNAASDDIFLRPQLVKSKPQHIYCH